MNKDTKRELTQDEIKRNENYENEKARLEKEGYKAYDLTTSVVNANIMSIVIVMPIVVIFALLYFLVNKTPFSEFLDALTEYNSILSLVIYLVGLFALVVIHELIHGITRAIFAKSGWKAISFGFIAKYLTPYCSCNEPLTKFGYLIGALMPSIILGVIPMIAAITMGNAIIFGIALIMLFSGGGDMYTSYKLLSFKTKGKESTFIDHPYLVGLTAFVKE